MAVIWYNMHVPPQRGTNVAYRLQEAENILSSRYWDSGRDNDRITVSDNDGANSVGEAHMKMSQPE